MDDARLTTAQTAAALGVRVATVYAYVSRGVLQRTTRITPEGARISLFDRDEVLALAHERARPRAGTVSTLIESSVTELDPRGWLAFRGHDVATLADGTVEQALEILWQRPLPPASPAAGSHTPHLHPVDAVLTAVLAGAAADPHRDERGDEHVHAVGWTAMRAAVVALGGAPTGPLATALWTAWHDAAPTPRQREAVDAALVCLLDHDLATATLAARVAASTRADPWMCLTAGLAALSGPRQAAAGPAARRLLQRWRETGRLDGPAYGFGHALYDATDPRAEVLLDRVADLDPDLADAVEGLIVAVAREHSLSPNVDLGLAALTMALRLPEDAPLALFLVARLGGLTAHVAEEYPHALRYRPRAVGGATPLG